MERHVVVRLQREEILGRLADHPVREEVRRDGEAHPIAVIDSHVARVQGETATAQRKTVLGIFNDVSEAAVDAPRPLVSLAQRQFRIARLPPQVAFHARHHEGDLQRAAVRTDADFQRDRPVLLRLYLMAVDVPPVLHILPNPRDRLPAAGLSI